MSDTSRKREGREVTRQSSVFTPPDGLVPPPLHNNQNFFLYNLAHEKQTPTCPKPGIRLLGVFETEAEAREMVPENPTASYFISPTHKFVPLVSSPESPVGTAIATISELHAKLIDDNNKDFEDMVEKQRTGVCGKSVLAIRKQSERTRIPRTVQTENMRTCPQITGDQCLAGQNLAVITVLQDIRPASLSGEQPLEPLVAVLYVTTTLEDASNYSKYTAAKHYPNNNMYVVDMYKWLFPEDVNFEEIANVEFGNETLNDIAKGARSKKLKIEELEK